MSLAERLRSLQEKGVAATSSLSPTTTTTSSSSSSDDPTSVAENRSASSEGSDHAPTSSVNAAAAAMESGQTLPIAVASERAVCSLESVVKASSLVPPTQQASPQQLIKIPTQCDDSHEDNNEDPCAALTSTLSGTEVLNSITMHS